MRSIGLRHPVLRTLTAIAAGCASHRGSPQPVPAVIEHRVYAFMLCQECTGGERADVLALGGSAVPLLRSTLLTGPPPGQIARLTQTLSTPARPAHAAPSQATIALQLADFDAMYRVRAADALAAIGGDDARHALCVGDTTSALRPRIRAKIDTALARVGGTCP
jgi:hypothetical protein